ncbi:sigma-54-dependent Fis family transcriptional regulator [bacterium]|jgi:DNA-binding NtrC family response regulator|nr:sigma-54-dependent Fis family transcriptional regulator [bacterium]
MTLLPKLLVCDDDRILHSALRLAFRGKYEIVSSYHGDEALIFLKKQSFQAVILDIRIRTQDEGLKYIGRFRELDSDMAIIMVSGIHDFSIVKEALKLGADDYIIKDSQADDWTLALNRVLERKSLEKRSEIYDRETVRSEKKNVFIGKSPQIEALRKQVIRARECSAPILIQGETGTGKEVIARLLRQGSQEKRPQPFVAVDASTIQSSVAESLLFGYEKGAFTGADQTTRGLFEEADGGIIYFDEMANMPLSIQNKLLRVIQEKEVMRLGSSRAISLDFRIVSATNRDLHQMVKEGQFKDDLFHRINVIPILIPPLRERKEDIPLLIEYFLSTQRARRSLRFSEDALFYLEQYSWPGNVRELSNLISFLMSMAEGDEIDVADLPAKFKDSFSFSQRVENSQGFYKKVQEFEKKLLCESYLQCKGNVSQLALHLDMDRSHLYHKLKEYQIHSVKVKVTDI